MHDLLTDPGTLVYVAGLFYVLGLLIINQIILRVMILSGTAVYIIYYATVAAAPLWEAIYISCLIGIANVIGLMNLVIGRSRLTLPKAHRDIYDHFNAVPPGDFRKLMRLGHRHRSFQEVALTQENEALTRLYYIVDGKTLITRAGDRFVIPPGTFVGDVAYLTGQPASASATLMPGGEYIEWSQRELRRASERSVRFKMALESALSIDMAEKVARSVAPDEPHWRPDAPGAEGAPPV